MTPQTEEKQPMTPTQQTLNRWQGQLVHSLECGDWESARQIHSWIYGAYSILLDRAVNANDKVRAVDPIDVDIEAARETLQRANNLFNRYSKPE